MTLAKPKNTLPRWKYIIVQNDSLHFLLGDAQPDHRGGAACSLYHDQRRELVAPETSSYIARLCSHNDTVRTRLPYSRRSRAHMVQEMRLFERWESLTTRLLHFSLQWRAQSNTARGIHIIQHPTPPAPRPKQKQNATYKTYFTQDRYWCLWTSGFATNPPATRESRQKRPCRGLWPANSD